MLTLTSSLATARPDELEYAYTVTNSFALNPWQSWALMILILGSVLLLVRALTYVPAVAVPVEPAHTEEPVDLTKLDHVIVRSPELYDWEIHGL